ncbi:hypothetical protein ACHAWF_006230, partial [Thalassiosira exigua]
MKFPLHLLLASAPLAASYVPSSLSDRRHRHRPSTRLHYKEPEPKSDPSPSSDPDGGNADVWSVLASTERWISDTLDRSNRAARAARDRADEERRERAKSKPHFLDEKKPSSDGDGDGDASAPARNELPRSDNPYARKEVSYACETGADAAAVAAGVFRRVREARELGERHGRELGADARAMPTVRVDLDAEQLSGHALAHPLPPSRRPPRSAGPSTMRQTNVVVIPNCDEIADFAAFDRLVRSINQARRASRDFAIKRGEEDAGEEWVVSINCAHLHPNYGTSSPEEQLAAMKQEEAEGEVDVNMQEYKRRREEARRSPYPSVIVEVKSTPPPDFDAAQRRDEAAMDAAAKDMNAAVSGNSDVSSEDVQRLEALFGMSAASKSGSADDPFYDALGEAFGKKQFAPRTPLSQAQEWVLENDPAFDGATSTFTKSDTRHVDAAYEYVFNNLAMLDANHSQFPPSSRRGQKGYVVLPNFLLTSATSFDRFAGQVSNIVRAVPSMADRVM